MKIIRSYLKLKFDLVFFFFFFYTFKPDNQNSYTKLTYSPSPMQNSSALRILWNVSDHRIDVSLALYSDSFLKSVDIFKLYPIGPDSYDLKKNTNIFPKYGEKKMRSRPYRVVKKRRSTRNRK